MSVAAFCPIPTGPVLHPAIHDRLQHLVLPLENGLHCRHAEVLADPIAQ